MFPLKSWVNVCFIWISRSLSLSLLQKKENNGCPYFSSNLPWGDFSSSMAATRLDVKHGKIGFSLSIWPQRKNRHSGGRNTKRCQCLCTVSSTQRPLFPCHLLLPIPGETHTNATHRVRGLSSVKTIKRKKKEKKKNCNCTAELQSEKAPSSGMKRSFSSLVHDMVDKVQCLSLSQCHLERQITIHNHTHTCQSYTKLTSRLWDKAGLGSWEIISRNPPLHQNQNAKLLLQYPFKPQVYSQLKTEPHTFVVNKTTSVLITSSYFRKCAQFAKDTGKK